MLQDMALFQLILMVQYDSNIHWAIFTIDAQAVAYFDLFYLFSLYTGFGVAGNIGSFKCKF